MMHDSSSRLVRTARLAASLVFLLDGIVFATWVSRIPAIQEGLGLRNAVLGLALLMTSLGGLISMPLFGWFVARRGSRFGATISLALLAAVLPVLAWADGIVSLSFALFLFGAAFGAANVAGNAQAISVERIYQRPIMASLHAFFSLGGIAGALLGSFAESRHITPAVHFAIVGVPALVAGLILPRFFVPDAPEEEKVESSAPAKILRNGECLLLGAIAFCSMLGEGAIADWSAVFLRQVSEASAANAAMGFAAYSLMMTLGRVVGDRLTMAIGPVNLVRLGGALAACGLLLAMLLPSTVVAIVGFACVGAGLSSLVPTVFSAAGKIPGLSPSVAIATVSTIGFFGFLSGPPLIGIASEFITLRWALAFVVVAAVTAVLLAPRVAVRAREERRSSRSVSVTQAVSRRLHRA